VDAFNFVKTYKIPDNLLKETRNLLVHFNSGWQKHTWTNSSRGDYNFTSYEDKELDVSWEVSEELSYSLAYFLFSNYFSDFPESATIHFSHVRLNRYEKNTCMRIHWDNIGSLFTGEVRGVPVLSAVGLINKADEGGDFLMTLPDGSSKEYLTEEGTGVVFPSTFIFSHEVTEIKKGTRDSFVAWSFN